MDDEDFIRDVCGKMLSSMGYKTLRVKEGKEAMDLCLKSQNIHPPLKAALMDLTIPAGLGGREAAEIMHQINPELILIAMSGYSREAVMSHPARYGFTASIQKPFTLEELSRLLNRLFP